MKKPALDLNFWTGNPKSIKVSKDSDCSLVSNKIFSEIQPSNGLRPGPGEVGQGGLKMLHLWRHSQKIRTPQPKNFFECGLEDLPHLLNHWTAPYHFWHPSYVHAKPRAILLFWCENPQKRLDTKVLIHYFETPKSNTKLHIFAFNFFQKKQPSQQCWYIPLHHDPWFFFLI